jgi:DNA-binding MarR family transcriptional regulator
MAMKQATPKLSKVTSLLQSMFKTQQFIDELLESHVGIGVSAYRILAVLSSSRPLLQNRIALELGQTEANVSRQVRLMASEGLVKIAPNAKDKRQRNVTRTAKGERLFASADKHLEKHQTAILKLN